MMNVKATADKLKNGYADELDKFKQQVRSQQQSSASAKK